MSEQLPEPATGGLEHAPATYPVTRGQAREFMSGIAAERFIWITLQESGAWGGHLHRAVLAIALEEGPDDEEVDIIPLYVDEYVKQPPYWEKTEDVEYLKWQATKHAERNAQLAHSSLADLIAYDPNYEVRRDEALQQLNGAFGYFGQSDIPAGIIAAFDEKTNDRIRDKYFYGRNGLTGERYTEAKYPEYSDSPIPDPNT